MKNNMAKTKISDDDSIQARCKEIPPNLHNRIVEFLTSLPNIQDKNEQRALIFSASLDKDLEDQIFFEGTAAQFCQLLANVLVRYGTLKDERDALKTVLDAALQRVGKDKREHCDALIRELRECSQDEDNHENSPEKEDRPANVKRVQENGVPVSNAKDSSDTPQNPRQPLSPLHYAIISLIAFVAGSGLLWLYLSKADDLIAQGIGGKVFYILLIPLGFSTAAFLFGAMRSYATYTGNALGGMLELGGPVVIFVLVVIGGFKLVPDTAPFPLTVYVHGSKGHQDILLRNQGEVMIDLGHDRRIEKIGEKGMAYFPAIPAEFRNQEVPIRVDAEGFEDVAPNARYILTGKSMYVEIQRNDDLAIVFGTVRDEKIFLSGVRISIGDLDVTTDEHGRFRLEIPPDKQKTRQRLTAFKAGYQIWESSVRPETGQEVKIILMKK